MEAVEDFDPHSLKYRGTAEECVPALLDNTRGQGLCMLLLLGLRFDTGTTILQHIRLPPCPTRIVSQIQKQHSRTVSNFQRRKLYLRVGIRESLVNGLKCDIIVSHHHYYTASLCSLTGLDYSAVYLCLFWSDSLQKDLLHTRHHTQSADWASYCHCCCCCCCSSSSSRPARTVQSTSCSPGERCFLTPLSFWYVHMFEILLYLVSPSLP